ncbi:DUF397 domain-containing protein [Saccharopolyspora spinosa]
MCRAGIRRWCGCGSDSKDPDGPVLVFSRARWGSFLAELNG